jgi:acylpyruvate hydrolase
MRLCTVRTTDGTRAGRIDGDSVVLLPWPDVGAVLQQPDWRRVAALTTGERIPRASADLATLIPFPDKIICVGLNYTSHILEMGRQKPEHPTLFAKYRGALIGARDPIQLPRVSDSVDWEVELGVVIGRAGRDIAAGVALDHVGGYCVVNDVTARDWQRRTLQFLSGKTFEATTPVGPELVTPDEVPLGASGLAVRCEVDGVVMQDGNTDDLCFGVADIVAYVSQIITLLPGDIIATGTPGGVGDGRTPPLYLLPGQTVRTSVDGIGELVNECVRS